MILKYFFSVTLFIFIIGCNNKNIDMSDVETSLEGDYFCNTQTFTMPGSDLFRALYQSRRQNMVISPFGNSYLVTNENEKIHLNSGLKIFGINRNTFKSYPLGDRTDKPKVEGPFDWSLIRDNSGKFAILTGSLPNYWYINSEGFYGANYNRILNLGFVTRCKRNEKDHRSSINLINNFKTKN